MHPLLIVVYPLLIVVYPLRGAKQALEADDPGWAMLETPDRTGFRGLTCSALVLGTCFPGQFTRDGYRFGVAKHGRLEWTATCTEGDGRPADVVCFEPMGTDVHGVHAAVMVSEHQGAFPPNTLFRLKKVEAAGTWGSTVEMAVLGGVTAGHHGLLWLGRTA